MEAPQDEFGLGSAKIIGFWSAIYCVTLATFFNLPVPQFLLLWDETGNSAYLIG
jgi:hypothetical protein